MNTESLSIASVHPGLVEAIVLLRQARDKINHLAEEKEIGSYPESFKILDNISSDLARGSNDISELIGIVFSDRIDNELTKVNNVR